MKKIPYRTYLTEEQMPKQWYNLRADMKELPEPMLNPQTMKPVKKEDLLPIFCEELVEQSLLLSWSSKWVKFPPLTRPR